MGRGGNPNFTPGTSNGPHFLTVGEQTTASITPRPQGTSAPQGTPAAPSTRTSPVLGTLGPGGVPTGGVVGTTTRASRDLEERTEENQVGSQRTLYDLLGHPRHEQAAIEFAKRQRQLNGLRWLSQPATYGIADMSPLLQAHVQEAYVIAMSSLTHLPSNLPTDVFVRDPIMQVEFARLVALRMGITGFFNPSRSSFDANQDRLLQQQDALLHAMEKLAWDEQSQAFALCASVPSRRQGFSRRSVSRIDPNSSPYSTLSSSSSHALRAVLPRWR